jgi:hypothetical protein
MHTSWQSIIPRQPKKIYNDQRNAKRKAQGEEYRTKEKKHAKERRASSTADDWAKERARGKMRRVAERAKKAGLPHVLKAVEIHDLYKENSNFIAPLKLPDMCEGDLFYPPDTNDRVWTEQEKCHWFMMELRKSHTYRDGCHHYLSGIVNSYSTLASMDSAPSYSGQQLIVTGTASSPPYCSSNPGF